MKELIRQYAGTAIAVVTALVLIALVSEMSVVVEKGFQRAAHCVKQTRQCLKGTGGVDEKHNIRNTGLYGCGLYNRFLSEYLQYFHKKKMKWKTVFLRYLNII